MQKIIALPFILFSLICNSQIKIPEDNLSIKYIKTKKASKYVASVTNVNIKSKSINQYNVKVKIEMLDNKIRPFDANKFSLIIPQEKIRPVCVTYTNFTDKWYFITLIKNKPKYKSLEKSYKPDIEDTFLNYDFKGIQNIKMPICYEAYDKYKISFKRPDRECHETYFEPKKLRNRNVNLYFPLHKNIKNASLYYGFTKITEIAF
jgi:hypothetical protein